MASHIQNMPNFCNNFETVTKEKNIVGTVMVLRISISPINSEKLLVLIGVPQGSTLGPLHFLVYINNLMKCCKSNNMAWMLDRTNFILYADE